MTNGYVKQTIEAPTIVYFAASLFSYQELAGNILLAEAIERVSQGRYKIMLPQNDKQDSDHGKDIRDHNFASIAKCDMILINYNGTEIDSGTVVEQQFTRDLDMPAVIVRTDFRRGGDCNLPFNLMAGYYPRTELVEINAMSELKIADAQVAKHLSIDDRNKQIQIQMADSIARKVLVALDNTITTSPLMPAEHRKQIHEWTITKMGIGPKYAADILASLKEQTVRDFSSRVYQ
ncbi:unnamed protein product [Didymodactylos carnosus]|uniref:Nucleoside 2-deoxyribosyltransferase n=1 Tax=Didymodactylos carnosus TaxID=1234261 RepID=A0A814LAX2_9BILA|nr:unnamed protein product [Didymodactylos carnosus]CAF1198420.1 unnamed protein product [Didymodactylos carnosus]CAF3829254.1 unnamed protein product [Didymodactylos carnosus]CAF4008534.1 unnamed protein product [Didymodactylos carnosus]